MSKEAMKLALGDLQAGRVGNAMQILREALVEQPAQQEPVAWLTEERYAEMHTPKWTSKIQQVFSKDGILESQTIQYAPQSKPVSYPPAQRTWVGLTDKEEVELWENTDSDWELMKRTEAKLKEKNT